jgi:hypothetical protein
MALALAPSVMRMGEESGSDLADYAYESSPHSELTEAKVTRPRGR